MQQINIGDSISGNGKKHISKISQKQHFFAAQEEIHIRFLDGGADIIQPVLQTEDADILGHGNGLGFILYIGQFCMTLCFFFSVPVFPVAGISENQKSQDTGEYHKSQNPGV